MSQRSSGWFLHALLLATAFVVLAWPLALDIGLIAGAIGALVGTLVAETLVADRYRAWVLWLVGGVSALGGWLVSRSLLTTSMFAAAVTPEVAIQAAEMVRWSTTALGACVILRGMALRLRVALAVEGTVAVAAVVSTVAAHRDGMIARPLEVSDWFWRQGMDPVVAFLAVGIGAGILLAGLLLHGRSRRRAIIQLAVVLLLAVFMATRIHSRDPATNQKNSVGGPLQSAKDDPNRKGKGTGAQGTNRPQNGDGQLPSDLPEASRQGDGRPTAVVVFHRDVRPSGGVFYFRQAAFSQFNGSRLVTTSRLNVDPGTRVDFPYERRVVDSPPADPMGRTDIALDIAWLTPHPRLFALSDPVEVAPRANPDPGRFVRAYSVVSRVLTADYEMFIDAPAGDPDWDDEVWQAYTELPRDERYHRLAASLQSRLRDKFNQSPLALALTVKQYLEETTTYSFARRYEGDEPTAEFLFSEDRKGYCVHLAHAAAYLMRALGLPTRVSSGYAVEATNMGGGSSLLIKSADAHAWAELYLRGVGWIPIEVTPEKTDVKPKPFEEQDLQQLLGEMARREAPTDRTPPSGVRIMDFFKMAWAAVPWVLLALLMLAYAVKIWRYAAPFVDRRRPKLAYRAALDRLSAVGWTRGHGEPRERFAARLKTEVPSLAPLTAGLSGYVFGSVEPPENLAGAPLHALAQSVGHEVRQAVPTWRWLTGVLNPVSWWWSR